MGARGVACVVQTRIVVYGRDCTHECTVSGGGRGHTLVLTASTRGSESTRVCVHRDAVLTRRQPVEAYMNIGTNTPVGSFLYRFVFGIVLFSLAFPENIPVTANLSQS